MSQFATRNPGNAKQLIARSGTTTPISLNHSPKSNRKAQNRRILEIFNDLIELEKIERKRGKRPNANVRFIEVEDQAKRYLAEGKNIAPLYQRYKESPTDLKSYFARQVYYNIKDRKIARGKIDFLYEIIESKISHYAKTLEARRKSRENNTPSARAARIDLEAQKQSARKTIDDLARGQTPKVSHHITTLAHNVYGLSVLCQEMRGDVCKDADTAFARAKCYGGVSHDTAFEHPDDPQSRFTIPKIMEHCEAARDNLWYAFTKSLNTHTNPGQNTIDKWFELGLISYALGKIEQNPYFVLCLIAHYPGYFTDCDFQLPEIDWDNIRTRIPRVPRIEKNLNDPTAEPAATAIEGGNGEGLHDPGKPRRPKRNGSRRRPGEEADVGSEDENPANELHVGNGVEAVAADASGNNQVIDVAESWQDIHDQLQFMIAALPHIADKRGDIFSKRLHNNIIEEANAIGRRESGDPNQNPANAANTICENEDFVFQTKDSVKTAIVQFLTAHQKIIAALGRLEESSNADQNTLSIRSAITKVAEKPLGEILNAALNAANKSGNHESDRAGVAAGGADTNLVRLKLYHNCNSL